MTFPENKLHIQINNSEHGIAKGFVLMAICTNSLEMKLYKKRKLNQNNSRCIVNVSRSRHLGKVEVMFIKNE